MIKVNPQVNAESTEILNDKILYLKDKRVKPTTKTGVTVAVSTSERTVTCIKDLRVFYKSEPNINELQEKIIKIRIC